MLIWVRTYNPGKCEPWTAIQIDIMRSGHPSTPDFDSLFIGKASISCRPIRDPRSQSSYVLSIWLI